MREGIALRHEFVEYIPVDIKDGTVYVSIAFSTAVHKCCCGCGREVVTPLSPTDWKLIFDGETISLDPSIGNWSYPCQSHYWIKRNRVKWSGRWSKEQIDAGRQDDFTAKATFFGNNHADGPGVGDVGPRSAASEAPQSGIQSKWSNLMKRWFGRGRR